MVALFDIPVIRREVNCLEYLCLGGWCVLSGSGLLIASKLLVVHGKSCKAIQNPQRRGRDFSS